MSEEIRMDIVSVAPSKGLTDAARDVYHLKGEADDLTASFGKLEDGTFDLDKAIEDTRIEVKRLHEEFARTGEQGFLREVRGQEGMLRRLERAAKSVVPGPGKDDNIGDLKSMIGSIPSVGRGALIGSVVGLGALMAPAIGAIVSGAVVGAAGAGGVVGGIIAASKDSRVQSAWHRFTQDTFTMEMFGGDKFVQPVIDSLGKLRGVFEQSGIDEVMGKAAGFVEPLADGIGGFVTNIMPGLSEAFAYEQLARCELAELLHTETEIVYDTPGKITDLEVTIDAHKIGVSVVRAMTFPFGDPYTVDAATEIMAWPLAPFRSPAAPAEARKTSGPNTVASDAPSLRRT